MSAFGKSLLWATLFASGSFAAASTAAAQAEFSAQVGWDGSERPSIVEFDSGSIETRTFAKKTDHYFGERHYRVVHAQQDFVVRWPDLAVTLRGRAQVPGPGSEPEFFKLVKPDSRILCNDKPIDSIYSQASKSDKESRIGAMLQIIVLLERRSTSCNDSQRRYLVNLLLKLNYDLAKDTPFFDFSPDVLSLVRNEYGDSQAINNTIDKYQDQINGLAMKAAVAEATRALGEGEFERFHQINGGLQEAIDNQAYAGAFKAQRISATDLRHREIQALYTQFEDRPRQLAITDQPSEDERAAAVQSYRAAERLAELSRNESNLAAFRSASLSPSTARQLPATARRSLELARIEHSDTLLDPEVEDEAIMSHDDTAIESATEANGVNEAHSNSPDD